MIHLFDYSRMSGRLFKGWLKLVQGAQLTNTLLRCEYLSMLEQAYIVRTHERQVEGIDAIGTAEELKTLVPMARKRGWAVDIFSTDHRNMHQQIKRQIDDIITPTDDPEKFVARRAHG